MLGADAGQYTLSEKIKDELRNTFCQLHIDPFTGLSKGNSCGIKDYKGVIQSRSSLWIESLLFSHQSWK